MYQNNFFRSCEKEKTEKALQSLSHSIRENFPVSSKKRFKLYPFSNECFFAEALQMLANTNPQEIPLFKIALLFGESHFISILPELAKYSELIVLADIEPSMHQHTQHLLDCLAKSKTRDEFTATYQLENPIIGLPYIDDDKNKCLWTKEGLLDLLTHKYRGVSSLQAYFFLSSEERFAQCRTAAKKLHFTHANLDILDHEQCEKFSTLVRDKNAILTLCNFTNIHFYDEAQLRKKTIPKLLEGSPNCFLMYAGDNGSLDTNITQSIDDYLQLKSTISPNIQIKTLDIEIEDQYLIINAPG